MGHKCCSRANVVIFWFTVIGLGLAAFAALVAIISIFTTISPRKLLVWFPAGNVVEELNPIDTTGWKTYKNEPYNFEILIPQDWIVETTPQGQRTYFTSPELKVKRDENEKNCNAPESGRESCLINMESAWDFVFHIDYREISDVSESVEINNRIWFRQEITDWDTIVNFSLPNRQNNPVYNFFSPKRNEEKTMKILSTFKFIEPATDTTGWQTYRNEQYGFEMKFPLTFPAPIFKRGNFNSLDFLTPHNSSFLKLYLGTKTSYCSEGYPYYFEEYEYNSTEQKKLMQSILEKKCYSPWLPKGNGRSDTYFIHRRRGVRM